MDLKQLKDEFYNKYTWRYQATGDDYINLAGHPVELWRWIEDKLKVSDTQPDKDPESNDTIQSVINWFLFSVKKPPDIVKEYITIDSVGDFAILEWYEGENFECCSHGYWSDKYGNEVTNIIYWAEKPCLQLFDISIN